MRRLNHAGPHRARSTLKTTGPEFPSRHEKPYREPRSWVLLGMMKGINMLREGCSIDVQHSASTLPQPAIGRLRFLWMGLLYSLLYAAAGVVMAGEGPIPVVEVKLTEFLIEMPTTVPPGPVTFSVTNAGTMEHNFEVEGQGIEKKFDTPLKAGETRSLRVDLPAGTYIIYCPVDDHQKRGMQLELKVAQQQSDRAISLCTSTVAAIPSATALRPVASCFVAHGTSLQEGAETYDRASSARAERAGMTFRAP
jgi:hypothetical protein